jgi:AcrR family transcriptional regulator
MDTAVMDSSWNTRPGRPTRESAPRRHAHLLDIAIRHFILHGVEKASIAAIAREANVSKATIYRHYLDKIDLFSAAGAHFSDAFMAKFEGLEGDLRPPEVVIKEVARRLLDSMARADVRGAGLEFTRVMWAEQPRHPELLLKSVEVFQDRAIRHLVAYLERGIERGVFAIKNVEMSVWHLMNMSFFYAHTMTYGIPSAEAERDEIASCVTEIFLYGVAPRPASAGPGVPAPV